MSTMLAQARQLTREAWEDDSFKKAWGAAELEVETAAKKGRFSTTLLYQEKDRAQAVAAKLKDEGFGVQIKSQEKEKYPNYFVYVSWSVDVG